MLQVDGYTGYRKLARAGDVQLAFCWAHVRRRFFEQAAGGTSPVATDALARIAQLYAVEADVRGQAADARRAVRQERSRPLIDDLRRVLEMRLGQVSRKGRLAEAIRYALNHWDGLCRFLDDGRIEMDSNTVERSIRPLTAPTPGMVMRRRQASSSRVCRSMAFNSYATWRSASVRIRSNPA